MAKAVHGSKSTAVRAYFSKNPGASVPEALAGLKAQGITTSVALVSKIKYSGNRKASNGRRGRRKSVELNAPAPKKRRKKSVRRGAAAASSDRVSLSELIGAKELAEQLGGVDKAREALAALARLQ
ncbi:MAG: hypothetical protein WD847_18755 [Pirellulales bacterium]